MSFDIKTRLSMLKSSAKARGLTVNLSLNKYQALIDTGCHFCGIDLKDEKGYCLDRLDSNGNYIISNVVSCCKICNRAKSNMNVHDFIDWLKRANIHMQKNVDTINKLKSLGVTEELFLKMEAAFFEEMTKNQQKERFKFIP